MGWAAASMDSQTVQQLSRLGFTDQQVRRMTACGRLTRVRRGVLRVGGVRPTWRSAALAAARTVPGPKPSSTSGWKAARWQVSFAAAEEVE